MNVLLIAPASGKWRNIGKARIFNGKTFRFSLLSLLSVAAATPADVEVTLVDEQVGDIPFDGDWDLVGITCMTAAAPRAYEIAERFASRGVPVVLGGMHPTLCPEEALRHADAVVSGDAEGAWPRLLEDARSGEVAGLYRREGECDLANLPAPPRRLLSRRGYGTLQAVQATRGCPNRCSFCSVSTFHGGRWRARPVAEVVREVASLPRRFVLFVDDNLTAEPGYAKELFTALAPLGKRWASQATLEAAQDEELVRLAARSGCVGLFIGLETFSPGNLRAVEKGFNRVEAYGERIHLLHDYGIGIEAGIVFGFDHDNAGVFRETLEVLERLAVDMVQVSILTPLPGTPFYKAMEDRILDKDWAHYDYHHVVFQPERLSPEELQAGHDWVTREFYRPRRIARRLTRMAAVHRMGRALPFAAAINGAYYGRVKRWGIVGWNPGAARGRERVRSRKHGTLRDRAAGAVA